jgi:hypothetical protein
VNRWDAAIVAFVLLGTTVLGVLRRIDGSAVIALYVLVLGYIFARRH